MLVDGVKEGSGRRKPLVRVKLGIGRVWLDGA